MKSKRSFVDFICIAGGILAACLTLFALVYLLWMQPFYIASSYGRFNLPGRVSEEKTEEITGNFSSFTIKNVSGPIHIESWDKSSVQVHYIKEARTQEALADFAIEIEKTGKSISVRPDYRKGRGLLFGSVSFDIKVPRSIKYIKAENVSGAIVIEESASKTNQVLSTVSGSIKSAGSKDLNARSTSGSIRFSSTGNKLYLKTVSGSIEGKILNLDRSGSVEIGSVSGSVEVEAFKNLDADLVLNSTSGSLSCDFPLSTSLMKRNRIEGKIGQGTVPFRVKTVSGRIRLKKLD